MYVKTGGHIILKRILQFLAQSSPFPGMSSRDRFALNSFDFGRFITSEGTKTLILAFNSKTGQSVAHSRHGIFLFGFLCQRMGIFRHFISLISNSRVQKYSR